MHHHHDRQAGCNTPAPPCLDLVRLAPLGTAGAAPAGLEPQSETARVSARAVSNSKGNVMTNYQRLPVVDQVCTGRVLSIVTGAPAVVSIGALPARKNTVAADVLAQLLSGFAITGIAAVVKASTTRLADVVFRLTTCHGWTIQRKDEVVGCKDGRTTTVCEYSLDPSTIRAAQGIGSVAWCIEVRKERAILRSKAADAQHRAAQANAAISARRRVASDSQAELFTRHD